MRTFGVRSSRLLRVIASSALAGGIGLQPVAAFAGPAPAPAGEVAPAPAAATGWTAPHRIDSAADCQAVAAGLDATGHAHVATECGGRIRYSTNLSGSWRTTVFPKVTGRLDTSPAVAFTTTTVYVAWTRVADTGGCGGGLSDTGVYIAHHSLSGGAWSAARRIGTVGDGLYAFRLDAGTLYFAVVGTDGHDYLETLTGSSLKRVPVPAATGAVALRIGSDGKPRLAFQAADGVRFATYSSAAFHISRITGSKAQDYEPVLALDGSNRAHVLFTRSPYGTVGCALRDPNPDDGTYYSTNRTGSWHTARISTHVMASALAVNSSTGRLHALVASMSVLHYQTALPGGAWSDVALVNQEVSSPVLLLRQSTGKLVVVYLHGSGSATGVYLLSKG